MRRIPLIFTLQIMKTFVSRLNQLFPLNKLLKLILVIAVSVQVIVITYSHLSGFSPLSGMTHFFVRLFMGVTLTVVAGFMITIPDLYAIKFLNRSYPWTKKVFRRIIIQFVLTVIIAVPVAVLITLSANLINAYKENLTSVLVTNVLISVVVNIILVIILEAWLFFVESDKAKTKAQTLEKELTQIRFEVLKNQINPHFMFNSLNVLSGLIDKDIAKAQLFIDEFSHIYRYVLETIEKQVVSVNEELGFVRSYIFLQQIRYGDALKVNIDLPAEILHLLMPPLSLQVVLENAIKHNIIDSSKPLQIDISYDNECLIIKNNIQPKISTGVSTGLGQKNMVKRYSMICDTLPEFMVRTNHYIVKLPLIKTDQYDSHYN